MNVQSTINTMNAWVQRRVDKGERPTSDEIWAHIHKIRPNMSSRDKEMVFEGVK